MVQYPHTRQAADTLLFKLFTPPSGQDDLGLFVELPGVYTYENYSVSSCSSQNKVTVLKRWPYVDVSPVIPHLCCISGLNWSTICWTLVTWSMAQYAHTWSE